MGDDEILAPVREVYTWDHERLWRSIYAFGGSRHVADEAVADAFAHAVRGGDVIHDVTTSVWRSAFAIARDELTRRRTEPPAEPASAAGTAGDGDLIALLGNLEALDDTDRRLLAWCHVGGWSAEEMAPLLGMRTTTVRVKLRRADRRVAALLGGDAGRSFEPFDRVRVPDQWDDIVARAGTDDVSDELGRRRRRPLVVVAGLTAVVALVGALVVVVTGSPTPVDDISVAGEAPGPTGPATATIGNGQEVTLAMNDAETGEVTGTFRLRLYRAGGATLLEYEDVDVTAGDDVAFRVIEIDGRPEPREPHRTGSIGAIRTSDGTLNEPFTVRIALTDAAGDVTQVSQTVLLTPTV
jgi:DNA-directed RNA polymerase specialized sigma24 family protein